MTPASCRAPCPWSRPWQPSCLPTNSCRCAHLLLSQGFPLKTLHAIPCRAVIILGLRMQHRADAIGHREWILACPCCLGLLIPSLHASGRAIFQMHSAIAWLSSGCCCLLRSTMRSASCCLGTLHAALMSPSHISSASTWRTAAQLPRHNDLCPEKLSSNSKFCLECHSVTSLIS